MRGDAFQNFCRFKGEAVFAPVVELDQPHDPVAGPNRHLGHGAKSIADAGLS